MRKSVLLGLAMSMAMMPAGQTVEVRSTLPELGYWPTQNKHLAKRAKRKAAKIKARSCQPSEKQHKDRNKKGRP
jgi:hypothetical protein